MKSSDKVKILCISALALTVVGVAAAEARAGRLPFSLNRMALELLQPRVKVSAFPATGMFSEHTEGPLVRPPFMPHPRSPYKPPHRHPHPPHPDHGE